MGSQVRPSAYLAACIGQWSRFRDEFPGSVNIRICDRAFFFILYEQPRSKTLRMIYPPRIARCRQIDPNRCERRSRGFAIVRTAWSAPWYRSRCRQPCPGASVNVRARLNKDRRNAIFSRRRGWRYRRALRCRELPDLFVRITVRSA